MKVIGGGLPRTATTTQMFALEQLGCGSCWNESVVSAVPPERLLVWNPSEGWEPLCEFLEVSVPSEPLPRLNDTISFTEGIIGGALDVIGEWWEARERPTSGLHGAALN